MSQEEDREDQKRHWSAFEGLAGAVRLCFTDDRDAGTPAWLEDLGERVDGALYAAKKLTRAEQAEVTPFLERFKAVADRLLDWTEVLPDLRRMASWADEQWRRYGRS